MVPTWSGTHYHLRGNYCSWNCAKSDSISKAKAHRFPKDLTSIALFAFQISFRGKNCTHKKGCVCHTRFTGVVPAGPKEGLQAFGGVQTITDFRRGNLTIDSYAWVEAHYETRTLCRGTKIQPRYMYTLEPVRRVRQIDPEEEDPVVHVKRRAW